MSDKEIIFDKKLTAGEKIKFINFAAGLFPNHSTFRPYSPNDDGQMFVLDDNNDWRFSFTTDDRGLFFYRYKAPAAVQSITVWAAYLYTGARAQTTVSQQLFEKWFKSCYDKSYLTPMEDGCYLNSNAGMAWDAWQNAAKFLDDKPE
jgi:hypothetical protein